MQAYTSPEGAPSFLERKRLLMISLGVVVAIITILICFFYNRHEISIFADGKEIQIVMRGGTVGEAIEKANLNLGDKDIVKPSLESKIKEDTKITITRMVKVNLKADGTVVEHWVPIGTVGETLKKLNVVLNSKDEALPDMNKQISSGDTIEIVRYTEKEVSESVKIPYKMVRKQDNTMERGVSRIVQQGRDGLLQKTVKITYKNGKEVKREVIGEKIIREPVNKIVAVGTVNTKVVSRGGNIRFSRALTMTATAYFHTGNNTASGVYPYKGAVAVDPRVIPLGTKLYIEGYGHATALDVGGAIKGNRIDLFFETAKEARRWGRRQVKVYVLE